MTGNTADVVNTRVTGTNVPPAMRSPAPMVKMTDLGAVGGMIASASTTTDATSSALDLIWKPPITAARTVPSFSPVSVMVIDVVPDPAPAVVRAMLVVVELNDWEVAFKGMLLSIFVTFPKK